MDYIEVQFTNQDIDNEILIAALSQMPFETFLENEEQNVLAYIKASDFSEPNLKEELDLFFSNQSIEYSFKTIKQQNWNKAWESKFDPIIISNQVAIKASFHNLDKTYPLEILINPKMSFGTGHHETTHLMIEHLLDIDVKNATTLDYGSGTGVLGITAKKLGAGKICLIDNDEWAFENAQENVGINFDDHYTKDFSIQLATLNTMEYGEIFQLILANITKNVILDTLTTIHKNLDMGGYLLLSGFYASDEKDIIQECSALGLQLINAKKKNKWSALLLKK